MTNPSSTPSIPPEAAAAQHVIQIATGFVVSTALQVTARLGIPDRLAKGPKSAAELASEAGVQEDEKSGFRLNRIVPTQSPLSVIEALPA